MEFDQIVELAVDDRELVGDELLKHEGIFVLVDVVQSVHVGTQGSPQLPAVCLFHAEETFVIRMQILQLADVDQMLALNHAAEKLVVSGGIGLLIIQSEVLSL